MEGGRESRDKRNDVEVEVKIVKPLFDHTIGKRCGTLTLHSKYRDIIDCRSASIFLCTSLQRFPRYPSTFIASFGQILRKYMLTPLTPLHFFLESPIGPYFGKNMNGGHW